MAKQDKPTGQQQQHRKRTLWRVLLPGALLVALVLVLALRLFGTPPAAPLPLRVQASPSRVVALAHLEQLSDLPLPGGTSRFDYQSVDPRTRLLFISHLGASSVTVFDLASGRIRANIASISQVHGVLAIPDLGRVYASATGEDQVVAIDEHSLRVVATIPAGVYPDGMAYDPPTHRLFVSDETGGTETVIDVRSERQVATISLGGEAGNTQDDPVSHRIFVDVQTLNQLVAIDPATDRIIARYGLPSCDHDHSLLIDVPARLAFVACDGNSVLLTVDLRSMSVVGVQPVGDAPDVLALDRGWHLLYVASETGVLSVFEESGLAVRKLYEGFVATEAHTVAVDEQTHRIYLPLQEVDGQAVLRIAFLERLPASVPTLLPSPIATPSVSPSSSPSPSATPTPRLAHSIGEVLAAFCDAINRRDYRTAWQAFSRALQARHPEPAAASAWGRYSGCVVPEQSGDPSDWTVLVMTLAPGYRDQYGGQGQITYRFTMQAEGEAWKIGAVCQFLSEECLAVDWGS